jgi:hypothetical protein
MRHELLIYSGLLAVGLGASYWASLPESQEDSNTQALFTVNAANLAEVDYEIEGQKIHLGKLDGTERFWVTVTKPGKPAAEKKVADPHASEDTKAPEASEPVTQEFLAGDSSDKLFESFAPFEALRSLGKISDDRLKEFGLKEGTGKFILRAKDSPKPFAFEVGGKSYGSRNVFIRNSDSGEVYLAKQDAFDQLKNAESRLFERKIFSFSGDDIEGATVNASGKSKTIDHLKRDEEGQLAWSDQGSEAPAKASYKNWMEKFEKLKVLSYATKEQLKGIEVAAPIVEIEYTAKGMKLDRLAVRLFGDLGSSCADTGRICRKRSPDNFRIN